MAALTSANFAGLIADKILLQISEEDTSKTVPNETVIAAAGVKAEDMMFTVLGYDPNDATRLPAKVFTEVRLDVARLVLYQRREELLYVESGKHPVQDAADKALARLASFVNEATENGDGSESGGEWVPQAVTGLGRGF